MENLTKIENLSQNELEAIYGGKVVKTTTTITTTATDDDGHTHTNTTTITTTTVTND